MGHSQGEQSSLMMMSSPGSDDVVAISVFDRFFLHALGLSELNHPPAFYIATSSLRLSGFDFWQIVGNITMSYFCHRRLSCLDV